MVKILDTTLREGEQTRGVSFTVEEKLKFAKLIDDFGVAMIEAGHPRVSPKVKEAIQLIVKEKLNAEIISHVRAVREDIDAAIECDVDRVAIFLASSSVHLKDKLKMTPEDAINTVIDCVEYAKSHGVKVRYTPEDATRTDYTYLIDICNAAIEAGADRISIADTVGIMLPDKFSSLIQKIKSDLLETELDVHCHNDFGLATANALAAIKAGANCVHTTVNGIGERVGIVDLNQFVMALTQLEGIDNKYNLEMLTKISAYVEKISGMSISPMTPIVGENAFSHKSGVHTDGVLKNPKTYEAFDPILIGRQRTLVVDKYAGKRAVQNLLSKYRIATSEEQLNEIVKGIKEFGDNNKRVRETDILNISEKILGRKITHVPDGVHGIIGIKLMPNVYTTQILKEITNINGIASVHELSGDQDLNAYLKCPNINEFNNSIEEIREIPGILDTSTKIILKSYGGTNGNSI